MVKSLFILSGVVLLGAIGCADIKVDVPDYSGSSRPKVDSSRLPRTGTHAECRDELTRAYEEIRYQKDRVVRREEKIAKLERKKDALEDEVKRLEKRLKRYEDD